MSRKQNWYLVELVDGKPFIIHRSTHNKCLQEEIKILLDYEYPQSIVKEFTEYGFYCDGFGTYSIHVIEF